MRESNGGVREEEVVERQLLGRSLQARVPRLFALVEDRKQMIVIPQTQETVYTSQTMHVCVNATGSTNPREYKDRYN